MTTGDLREIGVALFGHRWQSALARELGVSDRTVRHWTTGRPIPEHVPEKLATLVDMRIKKLRSLLK